MKKAKKKGQTKAPAEAAEAEESQAREAGEGRSFFSRRGPEILLAILVIYVILLGIGVFAEVFKVQSILNWWIWRAPGS